jgi:hypothetical protein
MRFKFGHPIQVLVATVTTFAIAAGVAYGMSPNSKGAARATSDVYFTSGTSTNSLPVAGGFPGQYTVVASLNVPAGTYLLDASPFVRNDDRTSSAIARCILFVNGQSVRAAAAALEPSQGGGVYFGNVLIKSIRTLLHAGTVTVGCQKTDATSDPGYGSAVVFAQGNFLMAEVVGVAREQ